MDLQALTDRADMITRLYGRQNHLRRLACTAEAAGDFDALMAAKAELHAVNQLVAITRKDRH